MVRPFVRIEKKWRRVTNEASETENAVRLKEK